VIGNREEIQALKQMKFIDGLGVNTINVLAVFLYDSSVVKVLGRVIYSMLWHPVVDIRLEQDAELLVVHGCKDKGRKDYDNLVELFRNRLVGKSDYIEIVGRFSLLNLVHTLRYFPVCFLIFNSEKIGLLKSFVFALLYVRFIILGNKLEKILVKYTNVVTFCDAHPYENITAQMANNFGLETFTLQHGQYCVAPDMKNPDSEAILNFVSKKLLCWGTKTIDEFCNAGFSPNRFTIVGRIKEGTILSRKDKNTRRNVFGVMLSGENNKKSNYKLLEIADQVSIITSSDYIVRLHPDNSKKDYESYFGLRHMDVNPASISNYFDSVDFCLCYATGAIFSALEHDCPCHVYKDLNLPIVFDEPSITFNTIDELLVKLKSSMDCADILGRYSAPLAKNIHLGMNDDL
jgi:hypothetical protein